MILLRDSMLDVDVDRIIVFLVSMRRSIIEAASLLLLAFSRV
jgi:hypothetical protein